MTHIDLVKAELPTPLPTASQLALCIEPALTSKQPNASTRLSQLVAEASLAVMPTTPKDFNVDAIRIVKVLGGGVEGSRVVRGMVFGKEPDGKSTRTRTRMLGSC
jgi:T-complex protein 1 subunit theta